MTKLLKPYNLKGLELNNRVMLSPMCQYKVQKNDGTPTEWHYVHLVSRAVGGVGLICFEMTNVESNGRITENCLGLWSKDQVPAYKRIVDECHSYGSKVAIQIAHAGRKSTVKDEETVGPSAIAFSEKMDTPRALEIEEVEEMVRKFGESTKLAVEAGFDSIELHGAHGYLLHQFISPRSNLRDDIYGEYDRFPLEVIKEVRSQMPEDMPLILRVSAIEHGEDGYGLDHLMPMLKKFVDAGVDAFDVSTGGNSTNRPEVYPGYQVDYAEAIKKEIGVPVISVGALEDPEVAAKVVDEGQADMVAIGKGLLRQPYWPKEAAEKLGVDFDLPGVYNVGY
ncbi:NADPH dehydrogenase [Halalkalibacillus sediminis]|uniref:NADPH dehydrogenase n=1 Tax=Halalkalibacillus sediminis TaxID=2018042 RepID=A0A2I0QUD3_9BACI|nr:NADH:flavin oxidoreductase/NADH oxidase [Halalkalibacillus sediminis]PKR77919.1 NADPH dehydrogenase [Halalkalibacillus sediminis]